MNDEERTTNGSDDDSRQHARKLVAGMTDEDVRKAALAPYERIIITDSEHLSDRSDPAGSRTRFVRIEPGKLLTEHDTAVLTAAAKAGREIITWCSTANARSIATDVARRFNNLLPDGKQVRHVTLQEPDEFARTTDVEFADAIQSATPRLPAAPAKPAAAGESPALRIAAFYVDSMTTAERVLLAHPSDLLVITGAGGSVSDLRVLSPVGIWESGETALRGWLRSIGDEMQAELFKTGLHHIANVDGALRSIRRLSEPDRLAPMKLQAVPALGRLLESGELKEGQVTTCDVTELDANLRYLGTSKGVVDLESGQLLPRDEGRRALVTVQTQVAYDPDAEHPDVDKLFAHLTADERAWLRGCLGCAMHGTPARRCYLLEGPPAGGKSALLNAIMGALGPYATRPADVALSKDRFDSVSPELAAFTNPARVATIDEMPTQRVATGLLKRLMGGTRITYRPLYREPVEALATATLFMACNSGRRPRFDLGDKAMFERLRVLPYPAVPVDHVDEELRDRMLNDPDIRAAMLAWLVAAAVETKPNRPPDDIPAVGAARQEAAAAEVDEVEEFARRLAPAPRSEVLTATDVWREWCAFCGEEHEATREAGGVSRSGRTSLTSALRGFEPRLPAAKLISVDGKKVRGWRGWKLLTVEEAEAQREQEQEQLPNPRRLDVTATLYGEITAQRWYELSKPRQKRETAEDYEQRREQWKAELGPGRRVPGFDLIQKRELDATYLTFFADPNASPSATADEKRAAVLIRDDETMKQEREYYRKLGHAYEQDGAVACGTVDSLRELSSTDWDKIHQRCLDVLKRLAQLPEFGRRVDFPPALGQTLPPDTIPTVPACGEPSTIRIEDRPIGRWYVLRSAAPSTEDGIHLWSMEIDYVWRLCPEPRPPHPLELLGALSGHGAA